MPKDIQDLLEGYQQFKQTYFVDHQTTLYHSLATEGQRPKAIVIACADSRVDPAILTQAAPGDLFVVRNVANLVPPCENDHTTHHGTSAALEFAVCGLQVKHIIVLGHSQCGGIKALVEQSPALTEQSFIGDWMDLAKPARIITFKTIPDASLEQKVDFCTQQALIQSRKNLLTFPWIQSRVQEHKLFIHNWFFDIKTGTLAIYDSEKDSFIPYSN